MVEKEGKSLKWIRDIPLQKNDIQKKSFGNWRKLEVVNEDVKGISTEHVFFYL